MKGKRFITSLNPSVLSKTTASAQSFRGYDLKGFLRLFPSLPEDKAREIKNLFDIKRNVVLSTLPDLLKQARLYLNSGDITSCGQAIDSIMIFIHDSGLQNSSNIEDLKNLANAYYIMGTVKAAGNLKDREEAENIFVEAINFAKKCKDAEIQSSADNQLRSLELHRYKLREGESFDFDEEAEDVQNIAKKHN
jgi:hypothetical protein